MKKSLIPVAIITLACGTAFGVSAAKDAKKAVDPTVMVVNNKAIPLSEFEYLYNKNNAQQVSPQSVEDYAKMFVDYKLKVAEAEASGVDTTKLFLDEFVKYRDELANPYLIDKDMQQQLVKEAYNRMKTNRNVDYIMVWGGKSNASRQDAKTRIDSVRTAIVSGSADFSDMADKFSVDKNHGHMGWMPVNRFPYDFEKAVYDTKVGEISPVMELPQFGYFIVRVNEERPNPGEVNARHILKLTRNMTPEQKESQKAKIDSIYQVIINGASFEEVAKAESDDPGSAAQGGALGWFGPGKMVPEFEAATFALKVGEVSQPFESSFGYHIVQKTDERDIPSIDEVTPMIEQAMSRDSRSTLPIKASITKYRKLYKAKTEKRGLKAAENIMKSAPNYHDALNELAKDNTVVASVGTKKVTIADATPFADLNDGMNIKEMNAAFLKAVNTALDNATREYAIDNLGNEHPDYRNLINEYRDGMLLFEVSNQNVWEKATKDVEGVENYFRANKDKYATWTAPHFKGYVVFTPNDSILNEARFFMSENASLKGDQMKQALQNKFGKNIRIEQVLAAKGENEIIDFLAFGGAYPEKKVKAAWPKFFTFEGKVIEQPEESKDVKGTVTADYQQELEKEWINRLRSKYPVVINQDVLKQVKSQQ